MDNPDILVVLSRRTGEFTTLYSNELLEVPDKALGSIENTVKKLLNKPYYREDKWTIKVYALTPCLWHKEPFE